MPEHVTIVVMKCGLPVTCQAEAETQDARHLAPTKEDFMERCCILEHAVGANASST